MMELLSIVTLLVAAYQTKYLPRRRGLFQLALITFAVVTLSWFS
jgi:hypothetical protein